MSFRRAVVAVAVLLLGAAPAHAQRDRTDDPHRALLSAVRSAQRGFERQRRLRTPAEPAGSSGPCEVQIGRLCYWNNNHDPPPPREPYVVTIARDTLIAQLARAAAIDSTDDWIAGQRIRYLSEARRRDEAVAVASACRATEWWCAALRGLARHERGDHAGAAVAFDSALAGQSEAERCRWTDLSWWLDGAVARDYRRQPCGRARDAWERRFWAVARPLLMLPGNDLRAELLARRTMSRIRSQGAIEYAMAWGDDFAELETRYGWPTAWSTRQPTSMMLGAETSVVGHEPTPSFAFLPKPGAVATPVASAANDWQIDASLATMRYAPRYADRGIGPLSHQLARFRRGDSTLVVGAWDVEQDRAWRTDTLVRDTTQRDTTRAIDLSADTLRAALVLIDTALASLVVQRDSAPSRGAVALVVPPSAYLASLELFGPLHRRAARARYGVATLPIDTVASDLLLLAHAPPPGAPLDSLLADVLGARTIVAGTPVGLYWETYLPADTTAAEVTVRATRVDAAWYERMGRALRLDGVLGGGPQTPVAVRFSDAGRAIAGATPHTIALTWPADAPGTYRLEVTVRAGDRTATSAEVVRVTRTSATP